MRKNERLALRKPYLDRNNTSRRTGDGEDRKQKPICRVRRKHFTFLTNNGLNNNNNDPTPL